MKRYLKKMLVLGFALIAAISSLTMTASASNGIQLSTDEIMETVGTASTQLMVMVICVIAAVVALILVRKQPPAKRKFFRSQTLIAMVLVLAICVNSICFGPMSTLLDLVSRSNISLSKETVDEGLALAEEIANEGIVLLKNDDSLLPLSNDTTNLNVFGWSSTNPCYAGTGSGGSVSENSVSLLQGLERGGYTLNTELADFYTAYCAARPTVGMFKQDWTLPEPAVDTYGPELLSKSKDFSDVALIVITRVGGENADLPKDMSVLSPTIMNTGSYTENSAAYQDFPAGTTYLELSQTEKNMVDMVCSNFDKVIVICNSANAMELGWVDEYEQIKSVLLCPGAGQTGFAALGSILNGSVNPSAKTVDTFVYDLTATPTYNNFGYYEYLMLKNTDVVLNFVTDTESATSIKAMRTATHNILYTVANSRACAAGNGAKMLGWVKIAIVIDVLIAAALIVLEVLTLRNYKRRRNDDSIVVTRDKQ